MNHEIKTVASHFQFEGDMVEITPITQGYINATFCLSFMQKDGAKKRYILQNINTNIFKNPYELMENIDCVTQHIRAKILAYGGNPLRETLTIIKTHQNELLYQEDNRYWRAYLYIENATAYQIAEKPNLFYNSAKAFGKFQRLLADFPAEQLHETIKRFHDTKNRYDEFMKAVKEDSVGRVATANEEIEFIKERASECEVILNFIQTGEIPLRVTHNDTKLNNIMMDNETDEGICVLDLDTVMPGTALFDFGDSIRFGASTASEDEKDLSKVSIDVALFEEYAKGFLSEAKSILTECEMNNLAFGAKIITLEQAIRFLGDYLNGDIYYPVNYDEHNLVRARTQLKLVADMEEKFDKLNQIVLQYR